MNTSLMSDCGIEKYREFCANVTGLPIFYEDWWLDATVGSGAWDVVYCEEGGALVAILPFAKRKRAWMNCLVMPRLTQTLGPWMKEPDVGSKYATVLATEKDRMNALIAGMPKFSYFHQNFAPEMTNWLPWYWKGFEATPRYTYRITNLSDMDQVWNEMETKIRGDIRKAEKLGIAIVEGTLQEFSCIHKMTFARQGIPSPISDSLITQVDQACSLHEARKIFLAKDSSGAVHAGVYLIWNRHAAYYLMGGGDPELRSSGATSLAIWSAIKHAALVSRIFDFEGSMLEPVERFIRGFGARQVPFFAVSKVSNPIISMVIKAKSCLGRVI